MMKNLSILILFFVLPILAVQSKVSFAETKKVLVLHIIEENWDDLEFRLPLYRGGPPPPITKKEALKYFEEYKEKAIKKDQEIKNTLKEDALTTMRSTKTPVPPQKAQAGSQESGLYIKHEIVYLGKAYYMQEGDTFNKDAFRGKLDKLISDYYYKNLPEKISLLFEQKYFDKTAKKVFPRSWNDFKEIRFASDIYIMSVDNVGNLKIKYNNKEYTVKENSTVVLPKEEKTLNRQVMMQFREKYFKHYAEAYPWLEPEDYNMYTITSFLERISIPNETFNFGTKVTIINHGFEEIQGE